MNSMSNDKLENRKASGAERVAEARARDAVAPRVDVYESETELLLLVDLPGVAKESVDVRFDDGELVIDARRTAAAHGSLLAAESRRRDFHRVFALPEGLDVDHVAASLANGVLEVRLPKAPQKRARKIEVRAG